MGVHFLRVLADLLFLPAAVEQSENEDERVLYSRMRLFAKVANFSIASGKKEYVCKPCLTYRTAL